MADTDIEGSDLSAIIADEIRQAQTFDQTKRAYAIEYMRGEMRDLPARVNGSSQTSRDVADTLSWVLPGIVRVFTASDQMVEFEATQEGGEQAAEEASEYTNYSFFRENDGYRVLYNATHDGLLMGNGAACSYWCPEETKTKLFKDKTEEEIAVLLDEGWQGMGKPPTPGKPLVIDDPEFGQVEVPTYTVRLQKITERGMIRDMTLKPENLLLNLNATQVGERFTAYLHDDKTRSDLMDMADEYGWDTEVIQNLPRYGGQSRINGNEVATARQGEQFLNDSSSVKSGDLIDLYECYIRVDRDGDGIAELLQVWYAGNAGQGELLSADEWEDDVPFTDIPCYPVPHQWQAEGLYDRLADVQRVKTALLRQALDNTYAVNMPMREVEEGSVLNPDILVNPKFGGIIWKKKSSPAVINYAPAYTADKSFVAMQMMDEIITKRTGVSKATMALDPEALQNQTATASQNQRDAGYSQVELVARNMAELGWTKFFAKRRNLAKKYLKGQIKIPSRNGDVTEGLEGQPGSTSQYRTIQPEAWTDDMACTINVGLGTGSRDRDMQMLNLILNGQIGMADRLANFGMKAKAIEFFPKIRKTAVELAESSGLKNPDDYYPPISDEEVEQLKVAVSQPQPNPEIEKERIKIEAQKEIETIKAQGNIVKEKAQLEADERTRAIELSNDLVLQRQKIESDERMAAEKLAFEAYKLNETTKLEREKMANAQTIAAMKPEPKPNGKTA